VKEFQAMVDSMYTSSLADANVTYRKIQQNVRDNLWYFVFLKNVKQPLIINSRLRNIAEGGFGIGVDFSGEMFWYDN